MLRMARLRRRKLAVRLRALQASCRRRAKCVSALGSAHQESIYQYCHLVDLVTGVLRESGRPEPQNSTAVVIGKLAVVKHRVRQLAENLDSQQTQLARLMLFGTDLRAKLHRDSQRIRRLSRRPIKACVSASVCIP